MINISPSKLAVIAGLAILLVAAILYKQSIEKVVMPGRLAEAHAKYESQCIKCHSAFKKGEQNALCLDCHKDVAGDLKVHQGLHGQIVAISSKDCKSCHPDHMGRSFVIARLDKATFKHDWTDFPLHDAHAGLSVTCDACHTAGKKHRDAPKDCFSCHQKDDHHKGALGKNCADCHKETAWKETYFNHAKTHFLLTGKHQKVACNACHTNETYKNTPLDCKSCHMINDVHASPKEERCERCHNPEDWKKVTFLHDTATKYPLKGAHVQAACAACHKANLFTVKTGTQCVDCHKVDDVHKEKNGVKCASCHTENDWKKVTFDHDRDTHFKLSGRHGKTQCDACHKAPSLDMKVDKVCNACHESRDVHKGQVGVDCQVCHNEAGWKESIKFDHDLGGFPLIGQHTVLACSQCHKTMAFKDAKIDCNSCHAKEDVHKKGLGTECADCHNPNGWKFWQFDHDTQTKYKLEGPHAGIKCQACHYQPMGKVVTASTNCIACHEKDDAHKGQFGENCEQCHAVDSFKKYFKGRKN
ncbi:MAG: cytochrome C [Candidatus Omnitrophota bacterium]